MACAALTDSQVVRIADAWGVQPSDIEEMVKTLEPMLRKTEAKIIFEYIIQFSSQSDVSLTVLSDFVKGLFKTLRREEIKNFPGLHDTFRGTGRGN